MMVLLYQLLIFLIIVLSRANMVVVAGCIIWTTTHVIMPWLMILQFITIAVGWFIGAALSGFKNED